MDDNHSVLMDQFYKIGMLLRAQHHGGRAQGPFANPHYGQGRILAILKLQPEISQKDLSYLLDMRNQSLSELLTKLEKAGFITRTQSETDRRVMNIQLTEEGKAAAEQAERRKDDADQIFAVLSEEERKNLGDYLGRIIAELEKQAGGASGFADLFSPGFEMSHEMVEHLREHGMTREMIGQMRAHRFGGHFGRSGFGMRTPHEHDGKPDQE